MARENVIEKHFIEESDSLIKDQKARELLKTLEYQMFSTQQRSLIEKIIDRGAQITSKFLKLNIKPEDKKKLDNILFLTGYKIKAEQLYSFAVLTLLIMIIIGIILIATFVQTLLMIGFLLMILGFVFYYLIMNWPHFEFMGKLSKSAGDLVTSVIYMVIYMRLHANLEGALSFTAENLTSYMAFDFRKMLWDIESRRFASAKDALDNYVLMWSSTNPAFVDSVFLIESSSLQKDETERNALLDQASQRIIEGTYAQMSEYAVRLREPLNTIYMIGMVLPILGMVLLPLVVSFIAIPYFPVLLFVMYDVLLPVMVYMMLYDQLRLRPAGFPAPDISVVPGVAKPGHFNIKLGKKRKEISALIPAIIVALIFAFISYLMKPYLAMSNYVGTAASVIIIIGIAISIFTYMYFGSYQQRSLIEKIYRIQDSFASVSFQIASYLAEGYPPENAVVLTEKNSVGTPIEEFMAQTATNIKRFGMSLKQALFDPNFGTLIRFPSPAIIAAMRVFLEAGEKSAKDAASAMYAISNYFSNLSKIESQIRNLLEEITTGMKFEVGGLSPVMAGIVVGLTTLISQVLGKLGLAFSSINTITSGSNSALGQYAGAAATIFSIFNLSGGAISPVVFQIVVGIYIIELSVIIGYSVATILRPGDKIMVMNEIGKTILYSSLIYALAAIGVTFFFGAMGSSILAATF